MKTKSARYTATVKGNPYHANRLPMLLVQLARFDGTLPARLTFQGDEVFSGTLAELRQRIEAGDYRAAA